MAADPWLDEVTTESCSRMACETASNRLHHGNAVQRTIYHYWYHTGENMAIRQKLGHTDLPEFVGNIDEEVPIRVGRAVGGRA